MRSFGRFAHTHRGEHYTISQHFFFSLSLLLSSTDNCPHSMSAEPILGTAVYAGCQQRNKEMVELILGCLQYKTNFFRKFQETKKKIPHVRLFSPCFPKRIYVLFFTPFAKRAKHLYTHLFPLVSVCLRGSLANVRYYGFLLYLLSRICVTERKRFYEKIFKFTQKMVLAHQENAFG